MPRTFRSLAGAVAALLTLALLTVPARAELVKEYGDFRVHYNAFTADMLPPEMARNYGIERSGYRAVLNITVQKKDSGTYMPAAAEVTATATNLNAQMRRLEMREIREDLAVYYIADFRVDNGETIDFDIRIRPTGRDKAFGLHFRQQFFGPQ